MTLYEKLANLEEQTMEEFENENYSLDAFEQMEFEQPNFKDIPAELKEQTPLANFEKQIAELMDASGFAYKLELVALPATCDGGCYEPCYYLCWYDNDIHTKIFHFETMY